MNYNEFLKRKQKAHVQSGFETDELNSNLFDFQKFIVKRALNAGRYAIFAGCGLGKTLMQLEWANKVSNHTNGMVIILAPLGVVAQTIEEGVKFGIEVNRYDGKSKIQITNYDQLDNIDCSLFSGVVLDESSIIKSHEGAIRNSLMVKFANTPYKLACTATPSPNDPMELGNHSEFLNVMSRNEMLSMYFIHDGGETSKWRLKGHAVKRFYQFVGTWSIMLENPKDIGFPECGYDLPKLNMIESVIETPKKDNGMLYNETAISAIEHGAELRLTMNQRMNRVAEIVNNSSESFIVWVKLNSEGEALKKLIPDAIEVKGSDSADYKEKMLLGFAKNEFRVLITKQKIASFGLNFQSCHNQIFPSLDFSFEGLYQAIRRSYRFGQNHEVNIYLITTDTMRNVRESINQKQRMFEEMQKEMSAAVNAHLENNLILSANQNESIVENDWYKIQRGDSTTLIDTIEDESLGLSVFSPPFVDLYTYSNHLEDMGNSKDYGEFVEHFKYLISKLYKKMQSGRNVCVHCMDLPIQKGKEGFIGLRDFSNTIREIFEDSGFIYHSRITVWKDPVVEMQRTKALGLLHKQVKKDSTMSRVGLPDYVMVFRKDGDRKNPVHCDIPVDLWQKYASPVWMDINYSNTLNFRSGRDENDEKHICPLQLDTIERLIVLYSNEGDTVFTPFMGIGSEVYQAVKMNRKAIGFELKESYFKLAKRNIDIAMEEKKQLSLFEV